jgi:glycolate oxidase
MIADSLVKTFKAIVGDDNAWTDAADLHTYSYDAAVVDPVQPGLIVRPTSTEAL